MSYLGNFALLEGTHTTMPPETVSGLTFQVTIDSSIQETALKYAALREAIAMIANRMHNPFNGLHLLPVYFGANVACEACWLPEIPGGAVSLFLGDRMMFNSNKVAAHAVTTLGAAFAHTAGPGVNGPRGVADQMYDSKRLSKWNPERWKQEITGQYQKAKASEKAKAVVVHEMGHIIHEHRSRVIFWGNKAMNALPVSAALASEVSSYILQVNNLDEFVAEVFAGRIFNKAYSVAVNNEYANQGGPA